MKTSILNALLSKEYILNIIYIKYNITTIIYTGIYYTIWQETVISLVEG